MKKVLFAACMAALACGCTSSTQIEWGGRTAVRNADGSIVVAPDGSPYYESQPNRYRDSNWLTRREERDVSVKVSPDGGYEAGIGSRVNDVSTNGVAMVTGGIDSTTRLVSACAAAYATVAGGGAQADTAAAVVAKMVSYFAGKGGDASRATVNVSDGKVTISDGTVSTDCSVDGTCAPSALK